MTTQRTLSVGPALPGFGSWNWLGEGLIGSLGETWRVCTFGPGEPPPESEITVFLKFLPEAAELRALRDRSRIVFLPIDVFGSLNEIDQRRASLRLCNLIVVHSQRLHRYFSCCSRTEFLNHPLKYVSETRTEDRYEGPLIWVGKHVNFGATRAWLTAGSPINDVWILTDLNRHEDSMRTELGVPSCVKCRVATWNSERHVQWQQQAVAAIDVKGDDFRERHKPPAKTFDFLASGIPVISNVGSSPWLHAKAIGHELLNAENWTGRANREQLLAVREAATVLHKECSSEHIWRQFSDMLLSLA